MSKRSAKKAEFTRVIEAENRLYELMFILKPTLLESAVKKKLKEFEDSIEKNGGEIKVNDLWGKRRLAYRIKQFEEGIYVLYNLVMPTTYVRELEEHLRIDVEVIRAKVGPYKVHDVVVRSCRRPGVCSKRSSAVKDDRAELGVPPT